MLPFTIQLLKFIGLLIFYKVEHIPRLKSIDRNQHGRASENSTVLALYFYRKSDDILKRIYLCTYLSFFKYSPQDKIRLNGKRTLDRCMCKNWF